jgi:hypothetical protein
MLGSFQSVAGFARGNDLIWPAPVADGFFKVDGDGIWRGANLQKSALLAVKSSNLQFTLPFHSYHQNNASDAILMFRSALDACHRTPPGQLASLTAGAGACRGRSSWLNA